MNSNSKIIGLFLFCLCAAIFGVIAQNGKRAGQPYTTSCTSKESRCQKCRIYELQMHRMQGEITDEQFKVDSLTEAKYISKNCNPPQPPPPPVPGDSCESKRYFSLKVESGKLTFSIYKNEIINGKCKSTGEHQDVLIVDNSPILSPPSFKMSFEYEFVSYSNSSDPNSPFHFLDNYDFIWANASNSISYPDSSFAFLIPDSVTNKVYLVKPESKGSKKGTISSLPLSIQPKWFNYYNKKDNSKIELVFDDLVTIFSHDPNASVIHELLVDSPTIKKLIIGIKGNYKGKPFFFTTGYTNGNYLGLYNPFQFKGDNEISKAVINKLITSNSVDRRIKDMVLRFGQEGEEENICGALPSSFSNRSNPKYAIGNPDGNNCITMEIKEKVSNEPIDLLTNFGFSSNYYSWKSSSQTHQEVTWIGNEFDNFCQLLNLGIVDNDLDIVTSSVESSQLKMIFFFKHSPENLYCWTIKDGRLTENIVLNGRRDIFQLTGLSCLDYLNNLKEDLGNHEEEIFFLEHSDKNSFELLDGFNLDNPKERVILWTTEHQPSLIKNVAQTNVKKLGDDVSESKLVFLIADSQTKSWNTFQTRYSKNEWIRNKIISLIVENNNLPLDFWLGNGNRFGMCRYRNSSKYVTVYLDNQHREVYGERPFSDILKLIAKDEIIYNGKNSQPTDMEFFESCLVYDWNKWNKEIWRANPLGYFDRKIIN